MSHGCLSGRDKRPKLREAAANDGDVELECGPCCGPSEVPGHVFDAGRKSGEIFLHINEASNRCCCATR
jgi:hypothetical protein